MEKDLKKDLKDLNMETDSSRDEGGAALTNWLEIGAQKTKIQKGQYQGLAHSKTPTPAGEGRVGPCGKRGLKGSAVGAQDLTGNLSDLLDQLHTG